MRSMWREDRLHAWLLARPRARSLAGSQGHDGAVLKRSPGRRVVCVDQTVEGVHVELDAPPMRIGRKAVARAVSDLAACAARPREVLVALSAPRDKSDSWMRAVLTGASERAAELSAELVGGDLACAPGPAHVAVTALGELSGKGRAPGRDRARPGQVVLLTGPVGGSRLGRHLEPEPRLDEGRWLFERGATALMDVSDGLALDASRIARASGVRIDLDRIPVHEDSHRMARKSGREASWHALADGEDYELLATIDAARWRRVAARAARRFPQLVRIGQVRTGAGLFVAGDDGVPRRWRSRAGFLHGAS